MSIKKEAVDIMHSHAAHTHIVWGHRVCAYLDLVIQVYLSVSQKNTIHSAIVRLLHSFSSIQNCISRWTIYFHFSSIFNSHARIRTEQTKRILKHAKRLLGIDNAYQIRRWRRRWNNNRNDKRKRPNLKNVKMSWIGFFLGSFSLSRVEIRFFIVVIRQRV